MRAISIAAASAMAMLAVSAYAHTATPSGAGPSPHVAPMPAATGTTSPVGAGATTHVATGATTHVVTGATAAAGDDATKRDPLKQADVSKINGAAVYGSNGKEIGSVATELMQPKTRKIDMLVVRSGGVLGFGGREVALPIASFSWDRAKGGFTIGKTAKDLKTMAAWTGSSSSATAASGSSLPAKGSSAPSGAGR